MVDLYAPVSRPYSLPPPYRETYHTYAYQSPPIDLNSSPQDFQQYPAEFHQPPKECLPPPEDTPLNLSLHPSRSRSPGPAAHRTSTLLQQCQGGQTYSLYVNGGCAPPLEHVEVEEGRRDLPGVASTLEVANNVEVGVHQLEGSEEFHDPVHEQIGNLVIVSDLEVAQEEVVEAEVPVVEADVYDLQLFEAEEQLASQKSRNIVLKSKHDELAQKITKIRSILDSEARRERTDSVKVEDVEVEVKSEGEMEVETDGGLPALKRSRNHSWPQMATISSNQRKKEQNKLASKRFRERKKLELVKARGDISGLESKNRQLKEKAGAMQTEADRLKKILLKLKLIKVVDLPTGQSTIIQI